MHSILHGDCLALLPTLPTNSIDAIVTDPPAGISFMGREWDKDKGGRDHWIAWMQQVAAECLRCMKPGGHALVWALPRTSHWTATAWENAGWEVRDVVHHVFGSGFPKSLDVSKAIDRKLGAEREIISERPAYGIGGNGCFNGHSDGATAKVTAPATPEAQQWQGWGTALKPAVENWILLRKPLEGHTVAHNVLTHGTGALNIDASRVPIDGPRGVWGSNQGKGSDTFGQITGNGYRTEQHASGRWPPNLLHDGSEEVVECFPQSKTGDLKPYVQANVDGYSGHMPPVRYAHHKGDEGSAARFFPSLCFTDDERRVMYCPKASKRDRAGSKHPTVKPIKLIEWLCKLICPPGGTILDPFAGSGTTGQAALNLGFDVIMIEREAEYYNDILKRVSWPLLPADAP